MIVKYTIETKHINTEKVLLAFTEDFSLCICYYIEKFSGHTPPPEVGEDIALAYWYKVSDLPKTHKNWILSIIEKIKEKDQTAEQTKDRFLALMED